MRELMKNLRQGKVTFDNISKIIDYNTGVDGLPKSNVLKFCYANGDGFFMRPSGTEHKIKIYTSVTDVSAEKAADKSELLICDVKK